MSTTESLSVETLLREHSFEEIEVVRDNLAIEIDKRTELLKSIVKEKYRDIVETSDAIQSMRINLNQVEKSILSLDNSIKDFYEQLEKPKTKDTIRSRYVSTVQSSNNGENKAGNDDKDQVIEDDRRKLIDKLVQMSADMWEQFDLGNLKKSLRKYIDLAKMLEDYRNNHIEKPGDKEDELTTLLAQIEKNLHKAKDIMKNQAWHKIQSAEPNQVGIIDPGIDDNDDADLDELFKLSMQASIEFLVEKLKNDISDTSYHAQIRRYQPFAYFNTKTNQIEQQIDETKLPTLSVGGCFVRIPKYTSVELSTFLYEICRVINTITGFSLSRSSIVNSLKVTIEQILQVYTELLGKLDQDLKGESKRRRAMQLYFDLMYIRVLLNTSKDIELIEELDPHISRLAGKYERNLDSIELYMVSDAMHTNVLQLSQSTVRLYGLLIPNLR